MILSPTKRKVVAALAAVLTIASAYPAQTTIVVDGRVGNRPRTRMDWGLREQSLSEREFKRRYRLSKKSFRLLSARIYPHVARQPPFNGEPAVDCDLALSMTLRYCAGGHHVDIVDMHGVAYQTFYTVLWLTLAAINTTEKMSVPWFTKPGDAPGDRGARLAALSEGFESRYRGVLPGCVGALDGIAIKIRKPWLRYDGSPMTYYNRKGFYALNVQAICDSNYRFLWMSAKARGSSHDSTAWRLSSLSARFDSEPLPMGYWIAGDDAYPASNQLLSPWSGKHHPVYKDSFNYYQSSKRIHIEQAFGIYIARWGVLHRALICSTPHASLIVQVTMKLHNICMDDGGARSENFYQATSRYRDRDRDQPNGCPIPFNQAECHTEDISGRRRDLEKCELRKLLTTHLERNDIRRGTTPLRGGFRPYYDA